MARGNGIRLDQLDEHAAGLGRDWTASLGRCGMCCTPAKPLAARSVLRARKSHHYI